MDVSFLPPINAALNATAATLLACGYVAIRKRRIETHRRIMTAAFAVSTLFLACYVTYHVIKQRTTGEAHTRFPDVGAVKITYLILLISHLVLAIAVVPLVMAALYRAWRGQFDRHRRIARWTWPAWMYVSVTGVVIYLLLYHVFPQG